MACLICERSATYELVRDGQAEAEVCEACTEEFLAVDESDPTCVYCDRHGVYDVRTSSDGSFPDAENEGDTFATPYESVLCEEHFEELGGEKPAGSPEAADEEDVPDERAEGEAETERAEDAAADNAADADEADAEGAEGDDADETGSDEIEAEQGPDGGEDATTNTDGAVTNKDNG